MAILEARDILKIIPHRFPMLLIDRVLECDDKSRVVAIKNLTINEPFFQGHFPGEPVMPGVLQVEAMAQCGGVLVNRMLKKEGMIAYFLAIDNARFRRPCVPGDQLRFEVTFTRARLGMVKLHGITTVNGELASEADLMFAYKEG
jgi:beta-hydroxyacyl-ACP dehydratase FabZ